MCIGIWDCFTSQGAVDFIKARLDSGKDLNTTVTEVLNHCLCENPSAGAGSDNMTLLIILLQ